jgi:L-ascorbate metabolism protein UlaG (beta-lactamase superfamily)
MLDSFINSKIFSLSMKIGDIEINWLGHAGFQIKAEKILYIDPFQISGGETADIILVTHSHYDHCSIEDLQKIIKEGTIVVMPADCQSKMTKLDHKIKFQILEPGQQIKIENIKIQAIPAYNTNKRFHSKAEYWNGYVLDVGLKIYHAGDTDIIPEMSKLGKIDIALLPIGGTYTMTAEEAAKAASMIKPSLAIPMHYDNIIGTKADAEKFVQLCQQHGTKAEILEKV